MAWAIDYTATVKQQLQKLDTQTAHRILGFRFSETQDKRVSLLEDSRSAGKALRGPLGDFWRYRVGDCRVICDIKDSAVRVLVVRSATEKRFTADFRTTQVCSAQARRLWLRNSGGSILIVVDLNPIPVGILQVDLTNSIGARRHFGIAFEAAIFHSCFVEPRHKVWNRRDAEGKMHINRSRSGLCSPCDDVQLAMLAHAEPNVAAVVKRLGNPLQADHFFVEIRALGEVLHENRDVVELGWLARGGGLGNQQRTGKKSP